MFENVENFSEVLPGLLALLAVLAGWRAGRLALRPDPARARRSARRVVVLLVVAALLAAAEVVLVALMGRFGWVFAANRVLVALPPLLVPLIVAGTTSLPRLRRLGMELESGTASPASEPWLVVPVQITAVGALLCFLVVFVLRPVPPYALDALLADGVLVLAAALLALRQRRRHRRWSAGEPPAPRGVGVRVLRTAGALAVATALVIGLGSLTAAASRLPDRYDMGTGPVMDDGGGPTSMATTSTPVSALVGRDTGGASDAAFTLTAQRTSLRLSSGRVVDAVSFNGQIPGPELRVHDGDLVAVTLVNRLPRAGVTIHWHGIDVPNAADGVPGVTQDAVAPGQRFVYRFRVHQVGTFWYHSHQDPLDQVDRGLFGALVVLPRTPPPSAGADLTVLAHRWNALGGLTTLDTSDTLTGRRIAPGTPVRLRLVNTSSTSGTAAAPPTFTLTGVPFRVAAIDGTDLHQPGQIPAGTRLALGAGGRRDLAFAMPDHPVRLTDLDNPAGGLVLSPDGTTAGAPAPDPSGAAFDPTRYGTPAPTPFSAASGFDRRFTQILDDGPSFYDGSFGFHPTIDGATFPDTPMLMVTRGDLVKVTLIDRGHLDHPMHLHGHHALVLARNGRPVTGSPWWTDTLDLVPGQTYDIAFRADNPGLWMDHCHNLQHAASGMIMHLGYLGVHTPFRAGPATGNQPE